MSFFISLSLIFCTPIIEQERIGIEVSPSCALLKDFSPSIGGGIDIIFITGEKLGGSLGITILKNKGNSLFTEQLPGTQLVSAESSKYITLTGFELNYLFIERRVSPFLGVSINWLYFHEQSKSIYESPGWKITSWNNYRGNGFCLNGGIGIRYILKPTLTVETSIETLWGKFHYPPLNTDIEIKGISISIGLRV